MVKRIASEPAVILGVLGSVALYVLNALQATDWSWSAVDWQVAVPAVVGIITRGLVYSPQTVERGYRPVEEPEPGDL